MRKFPNKHGFKSVKHYNFSLYLKYMKHTFLYMPENILPMTTQETLQFFPEKSCLSRTYPFVEKTVYPAGPFKDIEYTIFPDFLVNETCLIFLPCRTTPLIKERLDLVQKVCKRIYGNKMEISIVLPPKYFSIERSFCFAIPKWEFGNCEIKNCPYCKQPFPNRFKHEKCCSTHCKWNYYREEKTGIKRVGPKIRT